MAMVVVEKQGRHTIHMGYDVKIAAPVNDTI